jgi:hypothetical protein
MSIVINNFSQAALNLRIGEQRFSVTVTTTVALALAHHITMRIPVVISVHFILLIGGKDLFHVLHIYTHLAFTVHWNKPVVLEVLPNHFPKISEKSAP